MPQIEHVTKIIPAKRIQIPSYDLALFLNIIQIKERLMRANNVPTPKAIMMKNPCAADEAIVAIISAVYKRAQGINDQRIPKMKGLIL
jgi:hypothetical protein